MPAPAPGLDPRCGRPGGTERGSAGLRGVRRRVGDVEAARRGLRRAAAGQGSTVTTVFSYTADPMSSTPLAAVSKPKKKL